MRIGFIDYYLDEWHANNYPRMLCELSQGTIKVTGAYGMTAREACIKSPGFLEQWISTVQNT